MRGEAAKANRAGSTIREQANRSTKQMAELGIAGRRELQNTPITILVVAQPLGDASLGNTPLSTSRFRFSDYASLRFRCGLETFEGVGNRSAFALLIFRRFLHYREGSPYIQHSGSSHTQLQA